MCCRLVLLVVLLVFQSCSRRHCRRSRRYSTINEVTTPGGLTVVGAHVRTENSRVLVFTGVPYAQPPVGPLRFVEPVKKDVLPGETLDARSTPPACLQNIYDPFPHFFGRQKSYSEDCLYLNIFTKSAWLNTKTKRPVIFYIHGGSFSNGDGISRDPTRLVANTDVLFVSLNYRLQLLGFLNYVDDIPKNLGLLDIIMALEWVQENIGCFGGDKTKVSIMGESAGGALVTYLHTSPATTGLFASSIALSGTMLAPWGYTSVDHAEQSDKWDIIMTETGCRNTLEGPLECLQSKTEADILRVMDVTYKMENFPIDTWAPVVDGDVIVDSPDNIMKQAAFKTRPLLSGICENEGSHMALAFSSVYNVSLYYNEDTLQDIDTFRKLSVDHRLIKNVSMPCFKDNGDQLIKMYTDGHPDTLKEQYAKLLGDWLLTCPQLRTAEVLAAQGTPVYQFIFNVESKLQAPATSWLGVQHNFDMAYELGLPLNRDTNYTHRDLFTKQDRGISRLMMNVVESFATDRKPSFGPESSSSWSSVGESNDFIHVLNKQIDIESLDDLLVHCQKLVDIVKSQGVEC